MSRPTLKSVGEVIRAAWANEIRDQLVMRFDNATARDAAIPSPTEGMAVYLDDVNSFLVYKPTTGWSIPWNMPWGRVGGVRVTSGVTGGASATMADTTGMTTSFSAVEGRLYRIYYHTQWTVSADTRVLTQIIIGSTRYMTAIGDFEASEYQNLNGVMEVRGLATATITIKMQHSNTAAVTISPSYASDAPWYLGIDDIGPDPTA